MKKKIVHIITYILFILFALIIIFPLIWMVITGFKTNQELFLSPFSLPETWHWENYVNAWNKGIGVYLSNSVIITVAATALSTFLSCLAAYPLSRLKFKTKKLWVYLILGGLMLAPQSSLISLFKMVKIAGLYDTRISLILIDAAFRIPFATFLIMTFYKSIKNHKTCLLSLDYMNISSFQTSFTKSMSTAILSVISFLPNESYDLKPRLLSKMNFLNLGLF